ncbi:DEAD/DEAH box helicase family protein [Saccharopolyspora gregorii]|uniref:DEAD/DEAH box helicase family protein n=1 Tax=Saccharopolyspora gregorii TaxID=33914 RepID=UPI0021ABCE2C|nr:DEAD/DEAH box helicase family protein [Saccharopolyspora gregorii]
MEHDVLIAWLGASAESYALTDPGAAMFKARQFGEAMAKWLVKKSGTRFSGDHQNDRLRALGEAGVVEGKVAEAFHEVRKAGNVAVHEFYADRQQALRAVERCFQLGYWLHRGVTGDRAVRSFVPPSQLRGPDPVSEEERRARDELQDALEQHRAKLFETRSDLESAQVARERVEAELERVARQARESDELAKHQSDLIERMIAERDAAKPEKVTASERENFVRRMRGAAKPPLAEREVRTRLETELELAGWAVQERNVLDLHSYQGVAVREVHMGRGYADYLLYVDRKPVGVIETKSEGNDLTAAQAQAANYAHGLTESQQSNAWRTPLPFQYVTDGNEVRFYNDLDPDPRTRRIFAVHQPGTLARWMKDADEDPAAPTVRAKLARLPQSSLAGQSLRTAQRRAIEGLERSLAENRQRALIQMATGAGKTYMAAASTYRWLRHAGARRVLFLVDRNNLGDQAAGEFRNFRVPDGGRKFDELYNTEKLAGDVVPDSLNVTVCTIQRLWLALTGKQNPSGDDEEAEDRVEEVTGDAPVEVGYSSAIPPETFDFIVVDECHRSIYGKWRAVLEYFDAFLVGLTATPLPMTFGFFDQNLVSEYSYDESVADGVNVQFEVYRIGTRIEQDGSTIDKGTVVPVRNTKTRRDRLEDLDDDYVYSGKQEGRQTISKSRLREVLKEFRQKLWSDIFPEARGRRLVPKTLIFAKTDEHAEEIVEAVKDVFGKGDSFVQKITAKAKQPKLRLKNFQTDPELRIAVTVDMIATGTDVKSLEVVFFLREPKTWYLFEQMKGRGARTIGEDDLRQVTPDATAKTHFVIVDAVGVTDSPRIETRPLQQFTERQISLEKLLRKTGAGELTTDEFSTLAGRVAALHAQLTDEERGEVSELSGEPIGEVVSTLVRAAGADQRSEAFHAAGKAAVAGLEKDSPEYEEKYENAGNQAVQDMTEAALRPLASNPELRNRLLELRRAHDLVIDEVSRDEVTISRGLTAEERAREKVSSFRQYMREHQAEIAPLQLAFQERRDLGQVYGALQRLAKRLARPPHQWTPQTLLDAYDELGKVGSRRTAEAGVPELVGILRHELGLDDEVRPYAELVRERYEGWLLRQEQQGAVFSADQQWWLNTIRDVVCRNITIEAADLRQDPFTERGGTQGFQRDFGPKAADILEELNQELSA